MHLVWLALLLLSLLVAGGSSDGGGGGGGEWTAPPPPGAPGVELWRQRVRQGQHGYFSPSLGYAEYFLGLLLSIPGPRPALLAFTAVRKFTAEDWGAKGIGLRRSFDRGRTWTTTVQVATDPPQAANLTREWEHGPYTGEGWDGISLGTVTYDNHTGTAFVHYTLCFNPCLQFGCVRPPSCGPDYTSRTMIVKSNSSFEEWDEPTEISGMLASGSRPIKSFAPGAGEGTQTAAGRLIICGYTIDCAPQRGQSRNCSSPTKCQDNCQSSVLILSDDHGLTYTRHCVPCSAQRVHVRALYTLRRESCFRWAGGARVLG